MNQKGAIHLFLLLAAIGVISFLAITSYAPFKDQLLGSLFPKNSSFAAAPAVSNITDNRGTYPSSQIPKYEKFEVSFDVATTATNLDLPYDANPPAGVSPGQGITVNGEFSQDNFATKLVIPAFYYQDFDYQIKGGADWFYPKNTYSWKLRFSPPSEGNWQYRIVTEDAGGTSISAAQTFTAISNSASSGFIKVSPTDTRYFEFDNGTYFPALSLNATWGEINWDNIGSNQTYFQKAGQNGIQLIRTWLSDWGIYSSDDSPWNTVRWGANDPGIKVPHLNGVPVPSFGNSDVAFELEKYWNPCIFYGGWHDSPNGPAIKRGAKYKVFIRYLIPQNLPQPVDATKPYGLTAKLSGWLDSPQCATPGQGTYTQVAPFVNQVSTKDASGNYQWKILEGTIDTTYTANRDFLSRLYIVMENVDHNTAIPTAGEKIWFDRVEIREDLGDNQCAAAVGSGVLKDLSNGKCGVNILTSPSADFHQYFNQRFSSAFDKTLDQAEQNNVYLKLVGLEKNEFLQNRIDFQGRLLIDNLPNCQQPFGVQECPGNNWFYGNWTTVTKTRWLQQAWWRYMQARWGYSTSVHSWELLNEGDPFHGLHYTQANEFAKYMHQFGNKHMVTTSNWTDFPIPFWGSAAYPEIDYADVHQYMVKGQATNTRVDKDFAGQSVSTFLASDWYDTASGVSKISELIGAKGPFGVNKPVMRGETGLTVANSDGWNNEVLNDNQGVWLHKYIWAGLNPGGVIESYWYANKHIFPSGKDFRPKYLNYYNFVKDIPLSNGNYQNAGATTSDTNLRTYGQKDLTNKRVHLWIDNKTNTWGNTINNVAVIPILNATVTIPNMPQGSYPVLWYDTYTGGTVKTETVNVSANGNLVLTLPQSLSTDIAVKIGDYTIIPSPSPSAAPSVSTSPSPLKQGDIDNDNDVDIFDYNSLLTSFGQTGSNLAADIDKNGKVDIFDYNILLTNFGK